MQVCTHDGLSGVAHGDAERCTIVPTLNASMAVADELSQMWSQRTPQEAHDVLALPDVTVTNQKDKVFFLPKLLEMSDEVEAHLARAK